MSEPHRREDGLPTIALAMIVKDEEETLERLLDSVGWTDAKPPEDADWSGGGLWRDDAAVDFVVIVDTGSEDGTRRIAKRRGCKLVDFDWIDDFSAARRVSFDEVPPEVDFVVWADGDDVLEGAAELRHIAARLPAQYAGTIHRYDYAQDEAGNCVCELWRERLLRCAANPTWDLPIHEVIKIEAPLSFTDEVIWHHRIPPGRERDPERNYGILKRQADEAISAGGRPDPRNLAYLGTEALALGRPEEAIDCFREYLKRPDAAWDEERCQVAHKLSIALRFPREEDKDAESAELEARLDEAAEAAFRAITERADWADGYIDLAEIALRRRNWLAALRFCETAVRLDPPQTLLIINPLEYSFQPTLMRSVALAELGRVEEAMDATQRCLAMTPGRPDLLEQGQRLQVALASKKAEELVLQLREVLVRHDENEKAARLMECAPYFTWDRPAIAQARQDQREMVLHATDPEVYSSYYRDNPGEAPFEMQGVPVEKAHETFHRVDFLRRGLEEQAGELDGELRVLDLSCNDGWMLANLAGASLPLGRLDGMELNDGAAARAAERLGEFDVDGEIVHANLFTAPEHFDEGSYDAVVCFETIEHVPDPGALLDLMVRMTKPGSGRIYVSTPDGAFERGNIPDWMRVESKGHLRAMRPQDVAGLLCERGVIENMELEQRLVAAAATPKARRGRVHLYAGPAEALPEKLLTKGMGGSETALVKVAEHLARRGYDVRVFAGAGEGGPRSDRISLEQEPEGGGTILYSPHTAWDPGERCDLFVSSRVPEVFDRTINARRRALWLHDADYGERLTRERTERCTDVVVLSEFQRELLEKRYPFLADFGLNETEAQDPSCSTRVLVSRNGIETSYFEDLPAGRKPWVAYTSSPDRGLDVLLEVWPEVRKRVPKAELHHCYAPYYYEAVERDPALRRFHDRVEELHEGLEGVVRRGSLRQRDVAELYKKARVWAYPSWASPHGAPFPEISCISAMEAQAGGAIPVCLDYGALKETVVCGEKIRPNPASYAGEAPRGRLSDRWREFFVDAIARALEDKDYGRRERRKGRAHALGLDWSGVADQWEAELLAPGAATPEREKAAA